MMPPQGTVYRMLAHAQTAFLPMLQTVGAIQGKLELAPRLRQLAILRVAQRDGCEYELVQHEVISRIEGVPEEQIASLRAGRATGGEFDETDTLVLRFVDEVLDQIEAGESTFAAMTQRFSAREIVELLVVIGQYHAMAMLLRSTALEPQPPLDAEAILAARGGAQRWKIEPSPALARERQAGARPNRRGRERRTGSLRDDQRAFTRQRLKEAALEVIARDGYPSATIDEIAATAGASRATFYLHFKSKADLIRELVETVPDRDREHIWAGLSRLRDPDPETVRAWLDEVIALYDAQRLYFLAVEQAVAGGARVDRGLLPTGRPVPRPGRTGFPRGRRGRPRAPVAAVGPAQPGFCFLWRVRGIELEEERTMTRLTQIWHDALSARQ